MWNVFKSKLIYARNRAGLAVDPYDLSPNLCDSNMSGNINLLNLRYVMFLSVLFPLVALMLLCDLCHKNALINHY